MDLCCFPRAFSSYSEQDRTFIYLFILYLAALGPCCCLWAFSGCGQQDRTFIYLFILYLAALGPCCCLWAFSGCGERGFSTLPCRAQAPQCSGFSGSRARAQLLWWSALVASWHVESSQTRDRTHAPCIGRQSLVHCTTREVPWQDFLKEWLQMWRETERKQDWSFRSLLANWAAAMSWDGRKWGETSMEAVWISCLVLDKFWDAS